jgi:hypothetical protein
MSGCSSFVTTETTAQSGSGFGTGGPRLKHLLGGKEEGDEDLGVIRNPKRLGPKDFKVLYQSELSDGCTVRILEIIF